MKATGIVRRIDDLGRIVIPKEIRRTLRIREADPLEIFTDREGEIILKKYSPIGEMGTFAKQYAESMAQVSGHVAMISDRDQFIAVAGGMKNMLGKSISRELEEKIDWTKAWGKKYPILLTYTRDVNVENYAVRLEAMIGELRAEYGYSELDAFLVLKDILASVWKGRKKKS